MGEKARPIGVIPRELWEKQKHEMRIQDLLGAIERYIEAGLPIEPDWVEELKECMDTLRPSG